MRPTKILISDDELLFASGLLRAAQRYGVTVVGDTTGQLRALAKQHRPDLILLDVQHPSNGRELLAELKLDPETCEIGVVMTSEHGEPKLRAQCLELGALDVLVKPFEFSHVAALARLLAAGRPVG